MNEISTYGWGLGPISLRPARFRQAVAGGSNDRHFSDIGKSASSFFEAAEGKDGRLSVPQIERRSIVAC